MINWEDKRNKKIWKVRKKIKTLLDKNMLMFYDVVRLEPYDRQRNLINNLADNMGYKLTFENNPEGAE